MRTIILAAAATAVLAGNKYDRAFYEGKFFEWLQEHRVEVPSGERFVHMLQNFANNHDLIEETNAKNLPYQLGHNQFSHLSLEEWKVAVRLGLDKPNASEPSTGLHTAPADLSALPASVDWVSAGAVTPVKDQGQCGSCWSFSTTGALEGAYKIKYSTLLSFSEQNLVDCDNRSTGGKDHGCNGGLMDNAFAWIKSNGGICLESDYKYVSGTTKTAGTCIQSQYPKNTNAAPKSYTDVQTNSDAALMSALVQQPVAVAIEADQSSFQLNKSGVLTAPCGTNLDHGVLAVGYGTLNGVDYYKVKNSWGPNWGSNGYILLARGISQVGGQCGILMGPPSYPNL